LAQPALHTWSDPKPLRLEELTRPKADPAPKAIACYGLLRLDTQRLWLRFVTGRPISCLTIEYLDWVCTRLAQQGKRALLLVWDNASWHVSQQVRQWIKAHNRWVKRAGGVRLLVCQLPVKSPWLNPIEPHWVHGKRAIVEPARLLTVEELITRVCDYFGCEPAAPLSQHLP
jgi:hypothetical protein